MMSVSPVRFPAKAGIYLPLVRLDAMVPDGPPPTRGHIRHEGGECV
ncbi:hypothetical protein MNBD_ALPHA04-343 [hydrothermal vent metagenome]|uniref:Uncharacterized protein n=1 Tax=hydrothermal vent metagenome TaxID=652676 RepID=A0A3B0SE71_9ZZZZ